MTGFFSKLKDFLNREPEPPLPDRGTPIPRDVPRRFMHPPRPVPDDGDGPVIPGWIEETVERFSDEADTLVADEEYGAAAARYLHALEMLPEPKNEWEGSTWLLIGIGDSCFLAGGYEQARNAFLDALHCPGGIDDSYIHMRLGQVELELGDEEKAAQGLAHAYRLEGNELLEDLEPKYLDFIKSKLPPPPGGWPA